MPSMPIGRRFTLVFGLVVLAIAAPPLGIAPLPAESRDGRADPATNSPAQRPDIVLVTVDAARADHFSGYGYPRLTTPAIDAFGRGSVVFTQAIAQAPYTKASVASLMTGLYASAHKTITTTVPFPDAMTGHPTTPPVSTDVLPAAATTLAERLHAGGYRTIGFTTNPFLIASFGFAQGFDEFTFIPGPDFLGADRAVAAALDLVGSDQASPLFLWIHFMEPHSPYTPPAWTREMFHVAGPPVAIPPTVDVPAWLLPGSPRDLRLYDARYDEELAAADVAFDVLVRELNDARRGRDTAIVLTADHGEQFLDHGGWEHSDTLYDELIHVPLIVRIPGVPPAVVSDQVELVDVYPTLLELAGVDGPAGLPGQSLRHAIGQPEEDRLAFTEIAGAQYGLRAEGWKLIAFNDGRQQLFDLKRDTHEQDDRSAAEPNRVRAMRRVLDRVLAEAIRTGHGIRRETTPVDPAAVERLRALGYLR